MAKHRKIRHVRGHFKMGPTGLTFVSAYWTGDKSERPQSEPPEPEPVAKV